jgi:hypothetical protein
VRSIGGFVAEIAVPARIGAGRSLGWIALRRLCLLFNVTRYVQMLAILGSDYGDHRYLVLQCDAKVTPGEVFQRARTYTEVLGVLQAWDFEALARDRTSPRERTHGAGRWLGSYLALTLKRAWDSSSTSPMARRTT